MKLGLGLPHYSDEATPDRLVTFARRAESLGYDSLWALERLLRPVEPKNAPWEGMRPPQFYANVFDPIETLTYVAAHTSTIRLGTSVIDALFHVPVVLARRLATLDHFSGGRLLAGLGQGWSADEFETANVPMRRRGNGFAEFIEAVQAIWGPDPVSFQGRFYRIPPSEVGVKPLQPGGVPILIGVLPQATASVERAGRMGLGLHPLIYDWKSFEDQLGLFRNATPDGREPGPVIVRVNNPVTETPLDEADRTPLSGSVEQVKADFERAAELGVDYVMWDLTSGEVPYEVQLRLLEPLMAAKPE
ncbi:TIGR03619 family F420-dependent LLM class oxidoreductase [Amycolatopsis sp. cmx-4-61]|uniref:TIGR03619 family F420-dependent LLM class oxidoreductase n=1 Tax=Amycolatopsis sp. cmx-4-61 TaxID=2790937 RepID=UPI00397DF037